MNKHHGYRDMTELGRTNVKVAYTRSTIVFLESQFTQIQESMVEGSTKQDLLVQNRTKMTREHEELEELLTKAFLLGG